MIMSIIGPRETTTTVDLTEKVPGFNRIPKPPKSRLQACDFLAMVGHVPIRVFAMGVRHVTSLVGLRVVDWVTGRWLGYGSLAQTRAQIWGCHAFYRSSDRGSDRGRQVYPLLHVVKNTNPVKLPYRMSIKLPYRMSINRLGFRTNVALPALPAAARCLRVAVSPLTIFI